MVIKVSNIVPKGYAGITLWPFGIYVSHKRYLQKKSIINHEKIHWEQQKELFGIIFYIMYGIEYLIKYLFYKKKAYRNLSSEREAYFFDEDYNYLKRRKRYKWIKYIFTKPKEY